MTVPLERNLHDAIVVRKDGAVTVAEVETPDLDVLIRGTRDEKLGIS